HPASYSISPNVAIDNVLQHFLPTGDVGRRVPFFQHVLLQVHEARAAGLDFLTDAGVPGRVALLDEVLQYAVGADLRGDLNAVGECSHAANMGVEEIDGLEALAAHFRVEVDAAGREAALAEDHQHALRGQVQIGRKLVGVPAQQQVAAIGVDGAEHA